MATKQARKIAAGKRRQAERAEVTLADELQRPTDSLLHAYTMWLPPWATHAHLNAYFLATVCMGVSVFAYHTNTTVDNERRLKDPVSALATVTDAQCKYSAGQYGASLTYTYRGVGPGGNMVSESISDFVDPRNDRAQCEAHLSQVDRTPVTVWHERGDPANQRWTLEEEDHRPLLWGLVPGIAFALWGIRAQRRIQRAKRDQRVSA